MTTYYRWQPRCSAAYSTSRRAALLIASLIALVPGCAPVHPQRTSASVEPHSADTNNISNPPHGWLAEAQSTFRFFDIAPGSSAIEQVCPFVPARLPFCPLPLEGLSKDALRDRASELDGKEVVVIGPMGEASVGDSVPHPAALEGKRCWALTVGTSGTADVFLSQPPWRWDGTTPTPYWCCGDASATCCGVTRSPMIAARGVYRAGEIPLLEHASLCAAQPGTRAAEQRAAAHATPLVDRGSTVAEAWPPHDFDARHWLGPNEVLASPFSIRRGESVAQGGCPFRAASIPPCAAGITAAPAHELLDHPELANHVVTVAGLLGVDGGGPRVSGPGPNDLPLRTGAYVLGHSITLLDTTDMCIERHCLRETRLACYGDDTGLCCPLPIEHRIVARGVFQIGTYWYIYKPLLCYLGGRTIQFTHL